MTGVAVLMWTSLICATTGQFDTFSSLDENVISIVVATLTPLQSATLKYFAKFFICMVGQFQRTGIKLTTSNQVDGGMLLIFSFATCCGLEAVYDSLSLPDFLNKILGYSKDQEL